MLSVRVLLRHHQAATGTMPLIAKEEAAEALRPGRPETVRWQQDPPRVHAGHPARRLRRYTGVSAGAPGALGCVWHAAGHLVRWGDTTTDRLLDHYLALTYTLSGGTTADHDAELDRFVSVVAPALVPLEPWVHYPGRGHCYQWGAAAGGVAGGAS